jgi:hypothetical protein
LNGGGTFESVRIEDCSSVVLSGTEVVAVAGWNSGGCLSDPDGGLSDVAAVVTDSSLVITGIEGDSLAGGRQFRPRLRTRGQWRPVAPRRGRW